MTNHSERTGPTENGSPGSGSPGNGSPGNGTPDGSSDGADIIGRERPGAAPLPYGCENEHPITLRTPAELADALPYLLGYRPEDSIVLVALHERDGRGRFGGRARLGIPPHRDDWDAAAGQLATGLVTGSERRGDRPEQMVAYLCQEPAQGETGQQVMTRLRALAQAVRVACGALDVPVVEALCISGGRFWSYCCDDQSCCPAEGTAMGLPGTSVLAAAATYAGIQVRGTLRELHARLRPREGSAARAQESALDAASMTLVARILDEGSRAEVAEETLDLARRMMRRLADAPPLTGAERTDLRDDGLLTHDEAARLILGLQDRTTRDRAAEWMEGDQARPALRLWRALARRCAGSYGEYAAAPLTLAGWVAWSTGDELEAREALAMALAADCDYLFARLLHQACSEGVDPESIRACLRGALGRGDLPGTGTRSGDGATENEDGSASTAHEDTPSSAPADEAPSASAAGRPRRACATDAAGGTRRRPGDRARGTAADRVRPRTPMGDTRPGSAPTGRARRAGRRPHG